MAGNYPDYPSWRIPYDKDGTVGFFKSAANVITVMSAGQVSTINDEDGDAIGCGRNDSFGLIFPRLMDIDGWYLSMGGSSNGGALNAFAVVVSADTTNGYDGTWTSLSAAGAVTANGGIVPGYRTSIQSSTALAKRAIRFDMNSGANQDMNVYALHLFGEPAAGENTDMLQLWHPTLNQRLDPAYFDWGNVPRGSSADKTFRVKNLSGTLTAQAPRVAMDVPTDATPSVPGWHTISKGAAFAAQQTLANLSPGAISSETLTLRRTAPSNAQLSVWAFRVFAESTTWV